MPFIAFLGCDGSGKSAVLGRVTDRLCGDGVSVLRGHWRPQLAQLGSPDDAQDSPSAADDPHGQTPRGSVSSLIKLGWLGFNWWYGWWKQLSRLSRDGVVLFDRYHADLLVDPRRYRYGGPMWAARLASRLMPQPDRVIFLDADPDVLLARKQEVSRDALAQSRAAYLQLAESHPRFTIIDASQPLDDVMEDVLRCISR